MNYLEVIGIGDKNKNNGILFLISTGERKVRIEVGYGLEGRITDGKTGRILDNYVIPYLKKDDWNNGIKNGFNAILDEVSKEYDITVKGATNAVQQFSDDSISSIMICGFIILFICFFIRIIFSGKNKFILSTGIVTIVTIIELFFMKILFPFFIIILVNFIFMLIGLYGNLSSGGYYSGHSSGGGGHSGGRRFIWWRTALVEDFKENFSHTFKYYYIQTTKISLQI